jgi:hypothetical protein
MIGQSFASNERIATAVDLNSLCFSVGHRHDWLVKCFAGGKDITAAIATQTSTHLETPPHGRTSETLKVKELDRLKLVPCNMSHNCTVEFHSWLYRCDT